MSYVIALSIASLTAIGLEIAPQEKITAGMRWQRPALATALEYVVSTHPGAEAIGPLSVSTTNPRYFADPSGKPVLLGGAHHWLNFIDSADCFPATIV